MTTEPPQLWYQRQEDREYLLKAADVICRVDNVAADAIAEEVERIRRRWAQPNTVCTSTTSSKDVITDIGDAK